eukprot:m.39034 g.39034  ORF g.39034 m.39034 type:complete len:529 (+) comp6833_c0_seq2:119-1705(+)
MGVRTRRKGTTTSPVGKGSKKVDESVSSIAAVSTPVEDEVPQDDGDLFVGENGILLGQFLGAKKKVQKQCRKVLRTTFEVAADHVHDLTGSKVQLRKLTTKGFDNEQIWAQLELVNSAVEDVLSSVLEGSVNVGEEDEQASDDEEEEREEEEGVENEEDVDEEENEDEEEEADDDDGEENEDDNEDDDDGDDDAVNIESLSKFEKQQLEMREEIRKLEEENLAKKPWQLLGEARAGERPENSLLEEYVDFENLTVPAPETTEEATKTLEDMIKQRIVDNNFDDVERRFESALNLDEEKELPEISAEKSKIGLAEIYEQEYIEATTGGITSAAERRLQKQHEVVKQLMMQIEDELNALTNSHYLPMRPSNDLTITTKASAITMEDVTPTSMAKDMQKAPEELKKDKLSLGEEELTGTDKKRQRRQKKKQQHHKRVDHDRKNALKDSGEIQESVGDAKDRAKKKLEDAAKQGFNVEFLENDVKTGGNLTSTKLYKSLKRQAEREADAIVNENFKKKEKRTEKTRSTAFKL